VCSSDLEPIDLTDGIPDLNTTGTPSGWTPAGTALVIAGGTVTVVAAGSTVAAVKYPALLAKILRRLLFFKA
jgi:hypothetical protein